MSLEKELEQRSDKKCELCSSLDELSVYKIPPSYNETLENSIMVCSTCDNQLKNDDQIDPNHWRCLNESMWSEVNGVKVVAYRMLKRLKSEGWPQELLDMMYIDDETLEWAIEGIKNNVDDEVIHKDSNGARLVSGDNVVLIKDLKVKGGGFTAKRGTVVRRVSLVLDNPEHIEGKVEGQQLVILTQYVKKN